MHADDDFRRTRAAVEHLAEPPPFGDLLEGGARVRRRRTVVSAVAVAAVAAAGFLLAGPTAHITNPVPTPSPSAPAGPQVAVGRVAFVDAGHGYALLSPCQLSTSCQGTWSLLRTADSGRRWHRVASPLDTRTAEDVAVFAHSPRDVAVVVDQVRYASADGGAHWSRVPSVRTGAPVDAVPAGDEVGYYCARSDASCPPRLSAYDPVTGITYPLRHQPPLTGDRFELRVFAVAGAGQVWLVANADTESETGSDTGSDTGPPRVLHSADGGGHWRNVPVPESSDWFDPTLLLTPDGSQVYLTSRQSNWSSVRRVWRLTDPVRGRWTPAATDGVPLDTIEDVQVLPDGELRYSDIAGNAWQTRQGATQVVRAPRPLMDGRRINVNLDQVVDGMMVATPVVGLRGDRILISTDSGLHWQVRPVHL